MKTTLSLRVTELRREYEDRWGEMWTDVEVVASDQFKNELRWSVLGDLLPALGAELTVTIDDGATP